MQQSQSAAQGKLFLCSHDEGQIYYRHSGCFTRLSLLVSASPKETSYISPWNTSLEITCFTGSWVGKQPYTFCSYTLAYLELESVTTDAM